MKRREIDPDLSDSDEDYLVYDEDGDMEELYGRDYIPDEGTRTCHCEDYPCCGH